MREFLIVGMGGMVGSMCRYGVTILLQKQIPVGGFPAWTLTVNIVGCLVIGLLGGIADKTGSFTPNLRLFLFLGVLGGFTTFSSFGYDSLTLMRNGQIQRALAYVALHLLLGFGAVWAGYSLGAWRSIAMD